GALRGPRRRSRNLWPCRGRLRVGRPLPGGWLDRGWRAVHRSSGHYPASQAVTLSAPAPGRFPRRIIGSVKTPVMIDLSDTRVTPAERDLLSEGRVAAVCLFGRNVVDRFQLSDYVAELRSLAGSDLIVAIDQEGGGVLRLRDVPFPPAAMSLGSADDELLTERVAAATGRGLRSVGVNLDFAPVADVNSNPDNPVIADRSFGSDPDLVSRHVTAFVRGLQGEGVAATLKHFPGHGDTDV